MAITIQIETTLDVVSKQQELVQELLGSDGIYIKMKETLEDLLDKGEIKGTQRAEIVGQTISTMAGQLASTAMSTALQWSSKEKELEMKKKELEYQLDILAQQKFLTENQVIDSLAGRQLKQAQLRREYGTPITDAEGNVISLGNDGKEYASEQNIKQDTANKLTQNSVLTAQKEQTYAATHKLVADTYVNHGTFTWSAISSSGLTGVTKANTGYVTLSDLQKQVAKEQAKGYAWNAWSNAATSSAGMLGTLVASEIPELVDPNYVPNGSPVSNALSLWSSSLTKLNGVIEPSVSI